MKKAISLVLSIIMLVSVFTVCASAASFSATSVLSVSATSLSSNTITYTVNVASNTTVSAALVYANFDSNVLEVYNAGETEDGVSGVFTTGLKYNNVNCFSVGFINSSGYKTGSSAKKFVTVTFKVKSGADLTKTTNVSFYCDEFNTSLQKIEDDQLIKSFDLVLLNAPETECAIVNNGVSVTWNAVTGAASYNVYRSTSSGSLGTLIKEATTAKSYIDTTVEAGTTYYYTVRAKNDAGLSTYNAGTKIICLPIPKIKSIKNSSDGIVISWDAVSGVDGYAVWKKVSGGSWTKVGTVKGATATTLTDDDCKAGIKYTYIIKAYKGSTYSGCDYTGVTGVMLATPTVTIANANGGVKVSWNAVTAATKYTVYRKTSSGSWTNLTTVASSVKTYTDKTAKSGTTYYYTVKPFCGNVAGTYKSSSALKYIAAPKISSASTVTTGINIKWSKITGATGYYIYRKTASGSYAKIATISKNSTVSYTDKTTKPGVKYIYVLKAYNGKTVSAAGTSVTTARMAVPATKAAKTTGGIKVTWNKIAAADSYIVYRKTGSGSFAKIATVKGNAKVSYVDKTAKKGTTYYYAVKPVCGTCTGLYKSSSAVKY